MNDSRRNVLERLRACSVVAPPLPDLDEPWSGFDDLGAQFQKVVAAVGGTTHTVADRTALIGAVNESAVVKEARTVCSTVADLGRQDIDLDTVEDPHALSGVNLAILQARLGVAENGAVWIDGADLPHRAIAFIAEHLFVVLEAANLVASLHDAYARIQLGAEFGVFISGPSKTADIEQALVIGAHGARSLEVFLVG